MRAFDGGPPDFDFGLGHIAWKSVWDPDLILNPQWDHLRGRFPIWIGLIVAHTNPHTGRPCKSVITFNIPDIGGTFGNNHWDVLSWDPLTVSPSLLCRAYNEPGDRQSGTCDDHGFIRDGLWVLA
jgi:hypothetical protein